MTKARTLGLLTRKVKALQVGQLSEKDAKVVATKIAGLYTGYEAERLTHPPTGIGQIEFSSPWSYLISDKLGRIGILRFKGVEVALFFQRQVVEMELMTIDPVPARLLRVPEDAWVRIDLSGQSARSASATVGQNAKALESKLYLLGREVEVKEAVISQQEDDLADNVNVISELSTIIRDLKGTIINPEPGCRYESASMTKVDTSVGHPTGRVVRVKKIGLMKDGKVVRKAEVVVGRAS